MQRFKNKHLLAAIGFVLLVFVMVGLLWVCLNKKTASFAVAMQEYYAADGSYQVVSLGASNTYASISPSVLTEHTGLSAVNLATSAQSLQNSYDLLLDLYQYHTPEVVTLELTASKFSYTGETEYDLIVLAGMQHSWYKLQYFLSNYELRDLPYYFNIEAKSFAIGNILNGTYFSRLLNPESNTVQSILAADGNYFDNGFYAADTAYTCIAEGERALVVDADVLAVLDNIVALCAQHGTTLVLITPPESATQFAYNVNLDDYTSFVGDYAAQNGLLHINTNLYKVEYIENSYAYFADDDHANVTGGLAYSEVLGEILALYLQDTSVNGTELYETYFYETFAEAMQYKPTTQDIAS